MPARSRRFGQTRRRRHRSITKNASHAARVCTSARLGQLRDKSRILDVVDLIQKSDGNRAYPLYAIVAPSISSQFSYAKPGQVITGLRELGFFHTVEAALGADMVAKTRNARNFMRRDSFSIPAVPGFSAMLRNNFRSSKSIFLTTYPQWQPFRNTSRKRIPAHGLSLSGRVQQKRWR